MFSLMNLQKIMDLLVVIPNGVVCFDQIFVCVRQQCVTWTDRKENRRAAEKRLNVSSGEVGQILNKLWR